MKVSEWLKQHPTKAGIIKEDSTLEQIMEKLLGNSRLVDLYVLNDQNQVIGHISYKKLAKLVLAEHCHYLTRSQILERVLGDGSAAELMESHFARANPDEELHEVLYRQLDHWVEDLPVIDEQGQLQGVINLTDILMAVMKSEK